MKNFDRLSLAMSIFGALIFANIGLHFGWFAFKDAILMPLGAAMFYFGAIIAIEECNE